MFLTRHFFVPMCFNYASYVWGLPLFSSCHCCFLWYQLLAYMFFMICFSGVIFVRPRKFMFFSKVIRGCSVLLYIYWIALREIACSCHCATIIILFPPITGVRKLKNIKFKKIRCPFLEMSKFDIFYFPIRPYIFV